MLVESPIGVVIFIVPHDPRLRVELVEVEGSWWLDSSSSWRSPGDLRGGNQLNVTGLSTVSCRDQLCRALIRYPYKVLYILLG